MAQIKKHQSGGKVDPTNTFVNKPVDTTPPPINPITFNVDGQDHQINEADFNAIADRAFTTEVKKGQAKLKDRSKWMNAFQTKLQEAKNGKFAIQSSGNTASNITYTPNDASYDGSASDGVGTNGESAQRSTLGHLIAPRAAGNTDQLSAILNGYIGEGVILNRNQFLQTQKDKEVQSKSDATNSYNAYVKNDAADIAGTSLGSLAYGKDWNDPIARKLLLQQEWGKEGGHVAHIDASAQKHISRLFDPYYDDKQDDYLANGVDIKALRNKYSALYDPNTKSFKSSVKSIGDLQRYSDAFDTVGSDISLFNKDAYHSFINGTSTSSNTGSSNSNPNTNPTAAQKIADRIKTMGAIKEGNVWKTPNGQQYSDEGLTRLINGKWTDGKFYTSGLARYGKYAPTYVGADGKPAYDYNGKDSGFYWDGQPVDENTYSTNMTKLQSDPSKSKLINNILEHNRNIDETYAQGNFVNQMTNGFINDKNVTDHGEYAFKPFGVDFKPAGAANISSIFTRGNSPIKGGIYSVQSNTVNHLGIPDAETAIVTDDGQHYRGVLRQDTNGKFKLYNKNTDRTLTENRDPKLQEFLNGLKADQSKLKSEDLHNFLLPRTNYVPSGPQSKESQYFKSVIPGFQIGGRLQKKLNENDANTIKSSDYKGYQATKARDLFKDGYQMSTQEKLEAGALAANLTGLGFSLTGAGSTIGAVAGAVGTSAQLAADINNKEVSAGDTALRAGIGYGLDAISFVPGLGVIGEGSKALRSLKVAAKWLLPALGSAPAGKLIADIISDKKSLSDLNVDDLRTITNGLHSVVAGSRAITNAVGTQAKNVTKLSLKDGDIELHPEQAIALHGLDGEAKNTQAKLFAIENMAAKGNNVSDVDLKQVKEGFAAKAKFWSSNPKLKEIVDVNTTKVGSQLKNVDDITGDSWLNKYQRWAIGKTAQRQGSDAIGLLGDYTRGPKQPVSTPELLGLPAAGQSTPNYQWLNETNPIATTPRSGIISDVVSPNANIRPTQGAYTPFGYNGNYSEVDNKTTVMPQLGVRFRQTQLNKNGGIIKAQQGARIPLLAASNPLVYQAPVWNASKALGIPQIVQDGVLKPVNSQPLNFTTPSQLSYYNSNNTSGLTGSPINNGINVTNDRSQNWLSNLSKQINVNDLSEFGRALATRSVNQRIDTRVNTPLSSATAFVDVPVKGDLIQKNGFYNQANQVQQRGGQATTSDGQLFTIQNLEAGRQANALRTQGDAADYAAIDRSRQMSIQNIMQNNQARTQVANQNNANLAQGQNQERQLNNQKIGLVAQPLLSFWENKNAESLRKDAYNKQIDGQIALSGLSNNINDIKRPLLARATDLYTKSQSTTYNDIQRKMYADQYAAVQRQLEGLSSTATTNALNLRKDLSYTAPEGTYSSFLKPAFAKGGTFEKSFNKSSTVAYKERLKDVRNALKEDGDGATKNLLQIQKLINKALKF